VLLPDDGFLENKSLQQIADWFLKNHATSQSGKAGVALINWKKPWRKCTLERIRLR